jgi:hypothetical protein
VTGRANAKYEPTDGTYPPDPSDTEHVYIRLNGSVARLGESFVRTGEAMLPVVKVMNRIPRGESVAAW